jgi:hypothetical protein
MLHLVHGEWQASNDTTASCVVPAYGISFPGSSDTRSPKRLVEYEVNTVWWNNESQGLVGEDIDE